jgi:hypothetical protein
LTEKPLPLSIYEINTMQVDERAALLSSLIPRRLLEMFSIDPKSFRNKAGKECLKITCPEKMPFFQIDLRRDPEDRDATYFLDVSNSPFGQMEISFIIVNDPDGDRFTVDRTRTVSRPTSGPRGGTSRKRSGRWRRGSPRGRSGGA